ncbi:threonine-phosphate decarboxylase CobD [Sporosarcina cyprini]|uniref:threonine-phosphate decarboxylase CobD n=1 Tax=Sporosarcina cyprini TaxID=2910523 RepID=UPI001EE0B472|nr:threonine-phosphate decarboxylase CobD [Sporosarcina cyprini]MCG3087014.1 threonine-phosphate decarboxylase CobD [Sporosarcina cyprini]
MRLPDHGANPRQLYKRFGLEAPEQILDFSENCNPEGPPQTVLDIWPDLMCKLSAYPHPDGEPFKQAAAAFHNVDAAKLLAGNGAAELLALLAARYRGKRAIVVHPTFSEYEATLRANGVSIQPIVASEENGFQLPLQPILDSMEQADVIYLCTPNNPTGILPTREELRTIILRAREVGTEVVLDEAFIDFVDESLSFIPELDAFPHMIVVRSMTKMYAIPGIRLGYIAADPSIIGEMKKTAPHWNVNGIAAEIGAICLGEQEYRERAIEHAKVEREKITAFLRAEGCTVTDSVSNFLAFSLKEGQDANKLYSDMLARGMVLRHSENFQGMDGRWLRVGMKSETDLNLLKEELYRWFAAN